MSDTFLFLLIFGAILVGIQLERIRAAWARREWKSRRKWRNYEGSRSAGSKLVPLPGKPRIADAAFQLSAVMTAAFQKRRLLTKKEAEIFHMVEDAVMAHGSGWRVMAQVSLGEILSSPEPAAYSAINSKRVDLLVVCNKSLPIVAVEYQGRDHYQGSAPARDAVKKEALRKAGVRYLEVTQEHSAEDIAHEISRIAQVERMKPKTQKRWQRSK